MFKLNFSSVKVVVPVVVTVTMLYLVIKRQRNCVDIYDSFLGVYTAKPESIQSLPLLENETITIEELDLKNSDYIYIQTKEMHSMGFNTRVYTKSFQEFYGNESRTISKCLYYNYYRLKVSDNINDLGNGNIEIYLQSKFVPST